MWSHLRTRNSLEHLKHDTIVQISLCNLINNAFLDPMKDYTALNDSILSAFDNVIDGPIVVTEEEVLSYLKCIRAGKSNGPDEVPNWKLVNICPIPKTIKC